MSAGFPVRPSRDDFGPEPRNRTPVRNAEYEMDGETTGRLLLHQIAGLGLLSSLAELVIATTSSPSITLLTRKEAWNTRAQVSGPYAPPTLARPSAGVITIAYPSQVPDWSGALQPLSFKGGAAFFLDDNANVYSARVIPSPVASSTVTVRGWVFSGGAFNPSDGTLLVLLR